MSLNFISLSTPPPPTDVTSNSKLNPNYYSVSTSLNNIKKVPKVNDLPIKVSKFSKVRLQFVFGDGVSLSEIKGRTFKFSRDELDNIFLDNSDKRKPDYSMIFLGSFKILNIENKSQHNVVLKVHGLPESLHPDISREILIPKMTLIPPNRVLPTNKPFPPLMDLIKGSQKIKQNINDSPIPDPIFKELSSPNEIVYYPIDRMPLQSPKSINCKCAKLEGGGYSCEHDRDIVTNTYYTFNIFNFQLSLQKLQGSFSKQEKERISVDVEIKYYFLHYFK